jgi:hypothetical protein
MSLFPMHTFSASVADKKLRPNGFKRERMGPPGAPSFPRRAVLNEVQGVAMCTRSTVPHILKRRLKLEGINKLNSSPLQISHSKTCQPLFRSALANLPQPLKTSRATRCFIYTCGQVLCMFLLFKYVRVLGQALVVLTFPSPSVECATLPAGSKSVGFPTATAGGTLPWQPLRTVEQILAHASGLVSGCLEAF